MRARLRSIILSAILVDIDLDLLHDGLWCRLHGVGFEVGQARIDLIQAIQDRLRVQIARCGLRRCDSPTRASFQLVEPLFELLEALEQYLAVVRCPRSWRS